MQPIQKPLDVPESVRLINATIAQWRAALEAGLDMSDKSYIDLLKFDLDCMAVSMQTITDWSV